MAGVDQRPQDFERDVPRASGARGGHTRAPGAAAASDTRHHAGFGAKTAPGRRYDFPDRSLGARDEGLGRAAARRLGFPLLNPLAY